MIFKTCLDWPQHPQLSKKMPDAIILDAGTKKRRIVSLLLDSGFLLFEVSGRHGGDMRILVRFTTSRGMRCLARAAVPCRGYPPSRPRSGAGTHIFGINLVFVPRKFNINDTSKSGQENMQQSSSCLHGGKQKKPIVYSKSSSRYFIPTFVEKTPLQQIFAIFFLHLQPVTSPKTEPSDFCNKLFPL